jgi:monoterpene epsilon-lactone hydrolase
MGGQVRIDRSNSGWWRSCRPQGEPLAERARERGVDARLELYAADGRLVHSLWPFLLEAAEAVAHAGRFIRDVL